MMHSDQVTLLVGSDDGVALNPIRTLRSRLPRISPLFVTIVVAPTFLASIYFGAVASDVYISESHFSVRSPDRQEAPGLGALLKGAGFSRSLDDTYTVHDFMHSRDALDGLAAQMQLSEVFGSKKIDVINRFNGVGLDGSKEALYRYFQSRISLNLDTSSSITTLRVSAYTAADSYRINSLLLEMGEQLVNSINERGRQDMVRFATQEVERAQQAVQVAGKALSTFRDQKGVFDPERQSALQLQGIAKLQEELFAARTQLNQLRAVSPQNPQVPVLEHRVNEIGAEMKAQMATVAGGDASLTSKTAQYEQLTLVRTLADKQLAAAVASLELAQNEAHRKQLYLERIVQPNKPDVAVEPRRLRGVLTTFVLGLIVWAITTLLIAGVREHHQ
jgi:capsular polysaccharide transport system permease protein